MPEATARLPLPVTLATALDERAHTHADRPALTFIDEASTTQNFTQLQLRSWQTGNVLQNAGVGRGDRVAILARNAPVFYELALAVSRLGAAMVGLNWRLAAPEIDVILANAEPALLLVDPDLAHLISDTARATVEPAAIRSLPEFRTAVDAASTAAPTASGQADDVVFILYTSGTTGIPKGVQLTNRNMAHSAWIGEHAYGMTDTSTNLVAMPLFHVGGMGYGLSAFFGGGHTVLRRDPDPVAVVQAIEEHRVTHTFLVPAVLQAVLDLEGVEAADLSSLELLVYGASPIGDAVLRRAIQVLGCDFLQAYGMTETAGTVVTLPSADHDPDGPRAGLLRSCGRALPWVEVRVIDPVSIAAGAPEDAAVGEVGEIWTRSGQNTPGYRNLPEESSAAITAEGWLRTGDAAFADENGYLFLFDRFKDMIVSGAENVYPAEVENVLYDHPDIAEAAVIGVPDDRWGETVKAVVVPRDGQTIDPSSIIELCRSRLARYKCPTSIDTVDALPRNASGKILKTELRAPYWQGHDRQIS